MSNVTVCVRFRPLSSKERKINGENVCIHRLDSDSFVFKDEKDEDNTFGFDRVFYQDSEQFEVYEFLAMPIIEDVIKGMNGTILTYGQTGAGKTYSMEGPSILECDENKKGLLQRVVEDIFQFLKSPENRSKYTVNLSMVEIYMEKVRDLLDLSKDNLQIKESNTQGIYISGATQIPIMNTSEALRRLSRGIANRAVGETQMNLASSRSHCLYIFSIHESDERVRSGKIILVDLAGSEKVEKTGAEGRVLEEAKTINKSLSALGNVINALTSGKTNHVPYRDSKLTRILQDALGGNSRTALLCCCSPSPVNASESFSTLRFGTRSKLIKTNPRPFPSPSPSPPDEYSSSTKQSEESGVTVQSRIDNRAQDASRERILNQLRENLKEEDVDLLEKLFMMEGIFSVPQTEEECHVAMNEIAAKTITSLHQAVENLKERVDRLEEEKKLLEEKNKKLRFELVVAHRLNMDLNNIDENPSLFGKFVSAIRFLLPF
ncbi:hypothetical protein LUZ60_001450 [Juncus effusus]|nr:hypothetical protein LUZ60_001450 [Juncus effusus]